MIEDKDKNIDEEIQSNPNPAHALSLPLSLPSLPFSPSCYNRADKGSMNLHYNEMRDIIRYMTRVTIFIKEKALFVIHGKGFKSL